MSSERKSRRIQTTDPAPSRASGKSAGARRADAQRAAARPRHRGGAFSMDSEQSARLLLFGVTAAVLVAAAAFIAIGYYVAVVQPRNRTVLEVDGIKVSYAEMKRRMAFEYFQNPGFQTQQGIFSIPQIARQNLIDELTLISRAESALGVTATDDEYNAHLRTRINVGPEADGQTFSDALRAEIARSRMKRGEFERQVRADLLGDKVAAKLMESKPAAVPQAQVELISTADQETAQQAIDRINAGEPFADVARALSQETTAQTTGGVKDFQFDLQMPLAYRTFALTEPIGTLSGPLVDPTGLGATYVVRVIAREDRPISEEQAPVYESETYRKWLTDTQANMAIVDNWTDDEEAQANAAEPLFQHLIDQQEAAQEQPPLPQITAVIPTTDPNATTAAGSPAASTPAADTPAAPAASPPAVSTP
jgi:parvulin-like peptidyl-prolyl isomerase